MSRIEQQARDSLSKLIQYVFDHRDGLIQGVTYETLAAWIGRVNKHEIGHAHGMGAVLGKMGHILQGLDGEWGEGIPHLQSLVVKKSGPDRGLPAEGIREFWENYPMLSREAKRNRVRIEHQRIVDFGSRWNEVLVKLGLPKIVASSPLQTSTIPFGSGGESPQHKNLKEYVRQHPEIVGARSDWDAIPEYPLPSGDSVDVVFMSRDKCIAVEVKSSVSDAYLFDYQRGIYQTIKYGALLKAMSIAGCPDIPSTIQSVLVLESNLPYQFRKLARMLEVIVYENVRDLT